MRVLNNALVLGGAGFLGSRLVEALAADGVRTTVVDNLSSESGEPVAGADLRVADVVGTDIAALVRERSIDAVFHLAGAAYVPPSLERPHEDLQRNAAVTLSVLQALRATSPAPVLAYASSAAVYGDGVYMPMDEAHPLLPMSPYGISKLASEQYVRLYADLYGIPTFSVRLFSLYGPGQRKQVVYDLLHRLLRCDNPLTVLGSPAVSRDLVYVADAARAFVTLARSAPAQGEAYNAAAGKPTSLGELVQTLQRAAGTDKQVVFTGEVRAGDPLRWAGDATRARRLGVEFATPLEEGIKQTVAWLRREMSSGR
jgi:UDP-glucose 4-epimerase